MKLVVSPTAPGLSSDGEPARPRSAAPIIIAGLSLCLAGILALTVGKAPLSPALPIDLLLARFGFSPPVPMSSTAATILLQIRLPRIALAGLVGAALAVAGATYQGVFRNPLADPYLLGVASGASLGAVAAFVLPIPRDLSRGSAVQILAFVGAGAAVVAVYLLARVGGSVPTTTLLLAGIAVSAAASAAWMSLWDGCSTAVSRIPLLGPVIMHPPP